MKQGQFSDEQIVRILRETDQDGVAAVQSLALAESSIY